jgi:hypothetical protein
MGLLYGRAGSLTALFGGFRPGQYGVDAAVARKSLQRVGWDLQRSAEGLELYVSVRGAAARFEPAVCGDSLERKLYRVGPNCEAWPNTLTENPY